MRGGNENIEDRPKLAENEGGGDRTMRIGEIIKIKKCNSMPEVTGEGAEIVDMQLVEFGEHRIHRVWLKMVSGEHKGKVYRFHRGEINVMPKVHGVRRAGDKLIRKSERAIDEVKGKIPPEPALGFWKGKTPCWKISRCPKAIKIECPAFKDQSLPCWVIQGTYCKMDATDTTGLDTSICEICEVYKRYGNFEPIQIKLSGKRIDSSLKSIE